MTTILTKKKDTTGAPAPGDLTNSAGGAELAVNTFDKRLYTKDSGGNIVEIGTNPSTIDTTTVDTTNLEVTNIKAKDGTASATIANSTGIMTIGSSVLTTTDINGGTIDGTSIGATTASTGRFSDLTDTGLTSGRVIYAGTGGNLVDDADFTFNGTTVTMANDASINGIIVGKGAGNDGVSTVVGNNALVANTSGVSNNAFGSYALYSNTTGRENAAFGGAISGVALGALSSNTTGNYNSAFGVGAVRSNTTGSNNVGVGYFALTANTTASSNTAVGYAALFSNTTAGDNTAFGYQAGFSNTTGTSNTFVGHQAGSANTTGLANNCFGLEAGKSVTTANGVAYFGTQAGLNCTGANSTMIGVGAGSAITTGGSNTILGRYNGNQGGLDIRTASNYIVLSDGDGTPRGVFNSSGAFMVGKTDNAFTTTGADMQADGEIRGTRNNAPCLSLNRLTGDGILVQFFQDTSLEGNISVSGTTVSYNGGHLARWSQLPDNSKDDTILKGTVLTNLDDMCVWIKNGEILPNEQLNKMKVSDVEGDTNVAGVFVDWQFDEQCQSDDMNIAMTGDMIIRIADGVVVQKGDLLMSAGDGTAKPQGDDIVRSKTIAKVTSNYVTCTYADGSYCVPCVLMAC
jgi:hypothetical protein